VYRKFPSITTDICKSIFGIPAGNGQKRALPAATFPNPDTNRPAHCTTLLVILQEQEKNFL